MAKAINGHGTPKSAVAMAIVAISVALPLLLTFWQTQLWLYSRTGNSLHVPSRVLLSLHTNTCFYVATHLSADGKVEKKLP